MAISETTYRLWPALSCPVALLLLWQAADSSNLASDVILPGPAAVGNALADLARSGSLVTDLVATGARVSAGLLSALLAGVPVGLAFGYWQRLYAYLERPLHALRSVPATALFPLLLIIVGVGETAIIVMAAYPSFLIIVVNTVGGVRLANDRRVEQARAFGLGPVAVVIEVLFFEALPGILSGVRTAVSFTLVLVVNGGRERTAAEYAALLRDAAFDWVESRKTGRLLDGIFAKKPPDRQAKHRFTHSHAHAE